MAISHETSEEKEIDSGITHSDKSHNVNFNHAEEFKHGDGHDIAERGQAATDQGVYSSPDMITHLTCFSDMAIP